MAKYLQLVLKLKSKIPDCTSSGSLGLRITMLTHLPTWGQPESAVQTRSLHLAHHQSECSTTNQRGLMPQHLTRMEEPNHHYLKDGTLPNDRAEARKLEYLATRYILLEDILYKKNLTQSPPRPVSEMTWSRGGSEGDAGNAR